MQEKVNEFALITGASSGIGLELARCFAADQKNVLLIARSREKLTRLGTELQTEFGILAKVFVADLAEPSASDQIYRFVQDEALEVSYLINNAGFGIRGNFHEINLNDLVQMIQVNITALTHLSRLFLPLMLARKKGKILNVASTAAFQPGPWMAVYYATKAYVLSFSEALYHELKDSGVTVTTLCPGPTATGFQQRAGTANSGLMKSKMLSKMPAGPVAREGYEGLMKNKRVVIPGFINRVLAAGTHVVPRGISGSMAGSLNKGRTK